MDSQAMIMSALDEGVLVLRLARPERRNALDQSMVDALRGSLEAAATDDETRAVVLTGEGAAFCAGADLARFGDRTDGRSYRFESHRLTALTEVIERIEKPVVAAVETIAQSLLIGSEDHAEGVQAAREDRSPSFTGR